MIILASTSSSRIALLNAAGLDFLALRPDVDESSISGRGPAGLARGRARAKAEAIARGRPVEDLVIGADQVVYIGSQHFGKPRNDEDHLRMLSHMRGRRHGLVTAVALVRGGGAEHREFAVVSHLTVRAELLEQEIRDYIATGEGSGCAGGYMVEGRGINLFSEIRGDWTNILGMPMLRLLKELRDFRQTR